ncbi:iron-sulfur cluster-binding protein [Helicobacter sp. 13S00401-1]|uniref:LutB/LldF family L-lactate oxidation iron-sulfur protein n=1 Tax=Helicobacter sp. 13S00401-1 TaxID=1905758 RepID=UPI000BA5C86C|nr:LutB/LldF family L-lactate oxidation iron-sulfur protein [Helicobacter sp. 13S00401-1]PAF50240.1 iron-sulfur cluster-binding protein [Helicobacter sp. 13S00401-1]
MSRHSIYHSKQEYHDKVKQKLADKQLGANLKSGMDTLKTNRKKLIATRYFDWEGLREEGSKIKQNALRNLDTLLANFEEKATKNGIKVHWASTPDEANEIILKLAVDRQVTTILKGKSMASEEIQLNAYLQEKGIKAVETDLGELIIQLIDEPPVHIVVPAIHKNRNQIGQIFVDKLGSEYVSEPEELNKIARKHLRKEFEGFKMGISGVNFAIANEGALWLVENEGNGRMSTTACDIHVAICGIEKIVESFEDACILDTLLVPSATGATITCYNNIISSPRKEGELDGPKEVHVVMLDNNRSNMLSQPHYWKALSCIRCGTCLNHCPVYDKIGGHAYLSTYPGPIGEVISPQLFGLDNVSPIVNLCSLCNRCNEVCPVKIPLADLIRDLRAEKAHEYEGKIAGYKNTKVNSTEKKIMEGFASFASSGSKWRFAMTMATLAPLAKPVGRMIPILNKWLLNHSFPEMSGNLNSKVKHMKGVIYE